MFESIRKHSKIVMFLLVLLIIPSFILVGVDSNYFSDKSPVVARVDGHDINQAEWDNAHRTEADRIRAESPQIDPAILDSAQARYTTLERLVRDKVLVAAAQKMHLGTSDTRLARALQEIPQIAALKRADGTLDVEAYRALVGAQGMTPEGFEAGLRNDLSIRQVLGAVASTATLSDASANLDLNTLYQRRDVQVARFDPASFASQIKPTDADLETFYKAHSTRFQQPEHASIQYVVLNLDNVRNSIQLNEDDLRTYYKENVSRMAGKEERRASHILIASPADAPAAEREKAKARAQALADQVKANPASFAAVAKASSDDKGSAVNGGDVGFFGRGAMVKPFEDAAFALKKGEISPVVESDFGYHIIELTDVKAPPLPSFETLRPKIEADLKQEQAQRKYAEVAEAFTNGVYEQAGSLQGVADKLKLKVQTADDVTRTPTPNVSGVLANPKFLQALFADDAVKNKRNTDAIELGTNEMVAGRITSYQPARTLPLSEVKATVEKLFVAEESSKLARKQGESQLAAWKAQPASATGLSAVTTISREQPAGQSRAIIDAALLADTKTLPAWTGVDLGLQGYAVIKVERVQERTPVDAQRAAMQKQQIVQAWGQAETLAYYEVLKERFKVQIKVPRPAAISAESLAN